MREVCPSPSWGCDLKGVDLRSARDRYKLNGDLPVIYNYWDRNVVGGIQTRVGENIKRRIERNAVDDDVERALAHSCEIKLREFELHSEGTVRNRVLVLQGAGRPCIGLIESLRRGVRDWCVGDAVFPDTIRNPYRAVAVRYLRTATMDVNARERRARFRNREVLSTDRKVAGSGSYTRIRSHGVTYRAAAGARRSRRDGKPC